MVTTVKTQGTEIFFLDDYSSSDDTVIKMACPTGVTGLGGPADQIETTCLEAVEKTYARGLGNPGQVSIPFNFAPDEVSHQLLFDLKDAGVEIAWLVGLSDGTTDPTTALGALVAPAGRTSVGFVGYIADVNIDIATNEIVRGTLTVQRSGNVTWTFN
jgi:hypothetical protein